MAFLIPAGFQSHQALPLHFFIAFNVLRRHLVEYNAKKTALCECMYLPSAPV